jgi:hypothetical protein
MPGGYYPAHAVIPPAAHAIKVHPAHIGHNPNGALLDSHVTQIVPIYAEYAGAIIGKSGSRINDIRYALPIAAQLCTIIAITQSKA